MEPYILPAEAAAHAGLTTQALLRLCRSGAGPKYVKPSPKKILFLKSDIEAWKAGWLTGVSK